MQERYVAQHFDYVDRIREFVIYDTIERYFIYSIKTHGYRENYSPPNCLIICEALNFMEENKCKN